MDHADILNAYFVRIPVKDLEAILEAEKDAWHASMNLSTSSQLSAQKKVNELCAAAVKKIGPHDLTNLETIISR